MQTTLSSLSVALRDQTTPKVIPITHGRSSSKKYFRNGTYYFRAELTRCSSLIPNALMESVVSIEARNDFGLLMKQIRQSLNIPPRTPLKLKYNGVTSEIEVTNNGHVKTFLHWVKQADEMVTINATFDEEASPETIRLTSKSAKRRERKQRTGKRLQEECPGDKKGDKIIERLDMTEPLTKRSRKDIESATTNQGLHRAIVVHKKWEIMRQCIIEVSERLYKFDANREVDKDTGKEVLTRMTFEQVVDLAVCETAIARAIGISHMKCEIIAHGGELLENCEELSLFSISLIMIYLERAMKEYFVFGVKLEYMESGEVNHVWFYDEEATFAGIQSHLATWRKKVLTLIDLKSELLNYQKALADREAEHKAIVHRRQKVEREMERLKFAEKTKAKDEAIIRLVKDRMKAEEEAHNIQVVKGLITRDYNRSLLWRVEEEDFERRLQEQEERE